MASKKSKSKKKGKKRKPRVLQKKHTPGPHALVLVLNKKGQILIGDYRTGTVKKGERGAPGGNIEFSQTPRQAARDELRQEAKIRIRFIGKPFIFRLARRTVHVFIGHARGKPRNTPEMNRFEWVTPTKLLGRRKLYMRTRQAVALALPRLESLRKKRRKK